MKLAIPFENGEINQHFGHSTQFKIYDIADNKIASSEIVDSSAHGHHKLVAFLKSYDVDIVICGGIGGGAQHMLTESGIKFYPGVNGNADEAAESLIGGNLKFDPNAHCGHGDHKCGESEGAEDHHEHEKGEGHKYGKGGCGHGAHGKGC